jgi:hypothetical protein
VRSLLAATAAIGALALGILADRAEAAVYNLGTVGAGKTASVSRNYGLLDICLLRCSDRINFSTTAKGDVEVKFGISGLLNVGLLNSFSLTDNRTDKTYSQSQLASLGLLGLANLANPTTISFLGLSASSYTLTASRLLSVTSGTGTASVTVTPLPAAGWLLLSALGGLAVLRRRAARA